MHAIALVLMATTTVSFAAIQELRNNNCTQVTGCKPGKVPVRVEGVNRTIWILWRSEPDRASGALLLHLLEADGYCDLALCEAPLGVCDVLSIPSKNSNTSLVVGIETNRCLECPSASRLVDTVGHTHVPLQPRLHAALSTNAASRIECAAGAAAAFYHNHDDKLQLCDFKSPATPAYVPREWTATNEAKANIKRILANLTQFERIDCSRSELAALVINGTQSFVFVDAELWGDESRVLVVRPAQYYAATDADTTTAQFCTANDPDATPAQFFAEKITLIKHAPLLLQALNKYAPRVRYLRELLKLEAQQPANLKRSEAAVRAASFWAKNNEIEFNKTRVTLEPEIVSYRIVVYQCKEELAAWHARGVNDGYRKFLRETTKLLQNMTRKFLISWHVQIDTIDDCLNTTQLKYKLQKLVVTAGTYRLLGVVAAGAGVREAARFLAPHNVALVSYGVQPPPLIREDALSVGARTADIARALAMVLTACGWRRVALLSEDTLAAIEVTKALNAEGFIMRKVALPSDNATLRNVLQALQSDDARVFVVNAGSAGAARALAMGTELKLTRAEKYAWVAREWAEPYSPPLQLLALRSGPRSAQEADIPIMARLWSNNTWPVHAAPLTEALVTLGLGFQRLLETHPELRFDPRAKGNLELFRQSLEHAPLPAVGVARNLTFDKEGAEPPLVRLELWSPGGTPLTLYNDVNDTATCPSTPPISDGSSSCILYAGDAFAPYCLTWLLITGLLALTLAVYGAVVWRRHAQRRSRERKRQLRDDACTALLARQRGTVPALAAHHVERTRVCLLSKLGVGRHGRVWLAELAPEEGAAGAPRYVAAKEPLEGCSPAEESELLREAATLAPLRHEHVVLLMGVCVAGGPPLVLSEPAFFGDLQRYLSARRPLHSKSPEAGGEAAHVSATALTRLAREASLALAYLVGCGLVHCDVRAANCLVDERRSLKLADFGMARPLGTGTGAGLDEYACRRRKLFPVRWMAPESLKHGVFSPASDVWALGVLVLELVTLGERPFGALDSPDTVALVKAGGHARLPAACSHETRWLAHTCWRHEASTRPTASEVAAWLAERPSALVPAPAPQRHSAEDGDDDSGFGEAPAAS